MKCRIFFQALVCFVYLGCYAQSADERIGSAMNRSDWFALDSIYNSVPKDSIHPFLEVYSRCLIGNRFNRPAISIPAFDELLKTGSENLDLNLLLQSSVMFSMDLSRVGKNSEAHQLLASVLAAAYQMVDSVSLAPFADMAERYASLSEYTPYQVDIAGNIGVIPFNTVPVGKEDSGQYLMQLSESSINGNKTPITFDTGAGVNVITDSLAKAYGLQLLDAGAAVTGFDKSAGRYAIARELKMGNVTVTDVPFYVVDVRSHNEEADKYSDAFNLIVGGELMLQLKDVVINFAERQLEIPRAAASPSDSRPNMCFSSGMNFLTTAEINNQPSLLLLDSGDANYGALNQLFFEQNKEYITSHYQSDIVRQGGVGGTWSVLCYKMTDADLTLGGNEVTVPSIPVQTDMPDHGNIMDNRIGLRTMMLFKKLRFNLVDMTLTTEL